MVFAPNVVQIWKISSAKMKLFVIKSSYLIMLIDHIELLSEQFILVAKRIWEMYTNQEMTLKILPRCRRCSEICKLSTLYCHHKAGTSNSFWKKDFSAFKISEYPDAWKRWELGHCSILQLSFAVILSYSSCSICIGQ